MGYTFDCDGFCGEGYHEFPPFAGEFTESFLKTAGGKFAVEFDPGEKVTICADCMTLVVLSGKVAVCRRCGGAFSIDDLPEYEPECKTCGEDGDLVLREREVA